MKFFICCGAVFDIFHIFYVLCYCLTFCVIFYLAIDCLHIGEDLFVTICADPAGRTALSFSFDDLHEKDWSEIETFTLKSKRFYRLRHGIFIRCGNTIFKYEYPNIILTKRLCGLNQVSTSGNVIKNWKKGDHFKIICKNVDCEMHYRIENIVNEYSILSWNGFYFIITNYADMAHCSKLPEISNASILFEQKIWGIVEVSSEVKHSINIGISDIPGWHWPSSPSIRVLINYVKTLGLELLDFSPKDYECGYLMLAFLAGEFKYEDDEKTKRSAQRKIKNLIKDYILKDENFGRLVGGSVTPLDLHEIFEIDVEDPDRVQKIKQLQQRWKNQIQQWYESDQKNKNKSSKKTRNNKSKKNKKKSKEQHEAANEKLCEEIDIIAFSEMFNVDFNVIHQQDYSGTDYWSLQIDTRDILRKHDFYLARPVITIIKTGVGVGHWKLVYDPRQMEEIAKSIVEEKKIEIEAKSQDTIKEVSNEECTDDCGKILDLRHWRKQLHYDTVRSLKEVCICSFN